MKYFLVVKCNPLSDQYECDADRKPRFITDDWERDCAELEYDFEVYPITENGRIGEALFNYDEYLFNWAQYKKKRKNKGRR